MTTKRKQALARRLLAKGLSTMAVRKAVKAKYGSGIGQSTLTGLRKELGLPPGRGTGKKHKRENFRIVANKRKYTRRVHFLPPDAGNEEKILRHLEKMKEKARPPAVVPPLPGWADPKKVQLPAEEKTLLALVKGHVPFVFTGEVIELKVQR